MKRKRIELCCPRCGKEAHILFKASSDFKQPVCIACRNRIMEERGLRLKARRQRVRAG
ncbi:MAG: hypothetical protein HY204_02275 [Nitrospirae bacterium]|nr:hypothetical protein [Nitrospirota bacterium]